MTIDCVYFNDYIRCYRDGKIEKFFRNKYWRIVKNTANDNGYNRIGIDGKMIKRHRLIKFCFNYEEGYSIHGISCGGNNEFTVDHKNGNKLDNSAENLRNATQTEQNQNTNSKCYSFHKASNKWVVYISINKKRKHIGLYNTEEEAHKVAQESKIKHYPTFNPREN